MEDIIKYFAEGHTMMDLFWAIVVIIAVVKLVEACVGKLMKYFNALYKRKRGLEKKDDTLEKHTQEIKDLTNRIDNMINIISSKYDILNQKIDNQQKQLETIDREGKKRDCAVLRDRILGGMRYFGLNRDENGIVHISMSDHENMMHLFEEYFACGGNGTIQTLYENEFKHWVIDDNIYIVR